MTARWLSIAALHVTAAHLAVIAAFLSHLP